MLFRSSVLFATALATVAAAAIAASTAAAACEVKLGRGWASSGGQGTLTMAANGKPCGSTLYTVPGRNIQATSLALTRAPANGKVTATGGTFAYTPNKGFKGKDTFALSATGPGDGGGTTRLRGVVAVTVR